jgi:GNAT superfamily N-acetyltransferase
MEPGDLDVIAAIAERIHPRLPERPEVLAEKQQLFTEGCFALIQAGAIAGYGLSHPWRCNSIPPLDALLGTLPAHPDCLFVHDAVVLPDARGRGAAGALVNRLVALACARKLACLTLISVYGTHPLWARYGFDVAQDPSLAAKLASYGDTACVMRRAVSSDGGDRSCGTRAETSSAPTTE